MTWEWAELLAYGVAGASIGAAARWRSIARRARRRQFETAIRLDEVRRAQARMVRDLISANKRLDQANVRAEELNELAAAYVIVSQLDELRDDPAPHTLR